MAESETDPAAMQERVDWMADVFNKRPIDIDENDPEWIAAGQQFVESYGENRQALWDAMHRKSGREFLCLMTRMVEMDRRNIRSRRQRAA